MKEKYIAGKICNIWTDDEGEEHGYSFYLVGEVKQNRRGEFFKVTDTTIIREQYIYPHILDRCEEIMKEEFLIIKNLYEKLMSQTKNIVGY